MERKLFFTDTEKDGLCPSFSILGQKAKLPPDTENGFAVLYTRSATDTCESCRHFDKNNDTSPYCIKCAYCKNNEHILQIHLDGTLPKFCQQCYPDKWKDEFNKIYKLLLLKLKK